MGYAVYHLEKGKGGAAGIGDHIDRRPGKEHMYKHADPSRRRWNIDLTPTKYQGRPLLECIKERICEGYTGKKAIRKDAVTFITHVLTGSHPEMTALVNDRAHGERFDGWVVENLRFLQKEFGAENIVRFTIHLDEHTPHIHAVTVPLTQNGRLNANEIIGNPQKMSERQDRYAVAMETYALQRGIKATGIRHETAKEYYGRVNAVEEDITKQTLQISEIFDRHPINAFNIKTAKEAIRGEISQFVAENARNTGRALIEQNRALKKEMAAIQNKKTYAQIVAAAKDIKDKMPVFDYMTKLATAGRLTFEGRRGHEYYFARPDQKTGSISVNTQKNLWFDHSAGVGGDVIKAAKIFENKGFTDAVFQLTQNRELIQAAGDQWRKASQAAEGKTFAEEGAKAEITAILDKITHPALVNYLKERGISLETSKGIVKEIHWNVGDKRYFGIGLPNGSGGYALRNPVFKGNVGTGGLSIFQNSQNPQSIKIFEGFMDFLSYQEMNRSKPQENTIFIVLNSLSNLTKEKMANVAAFAQQHKARVELFFDNDPSGKEATNKVAAAISNVQDRSHEYSQFKDLNEALVKGPKEDISLIKSRGFKR